MIGHILLAKSYWMVKGFRHACRVHKHPHRWTFLWSFLAFCLFGVALGITWIAVDAAFRNVSIGETFPRVIITKFQAWNLIHKPGERRP